MIRCTSLRSSAESARYPRRPTGHRFIDDDAAMMRPPAQGHRVRSLNRNATTLYGQASSLSKTQLLK